MRALGAALLLALGACAASEPMMLREEGANPMRAPAIPRAETKPAPLQPGYLGLFGLGLIRVYQLFIAPLNFGSCPFETSCSRYGAGRVRENGFLGLIEAVERVLRCNPSAAAFHPTVVRDGRHILQDR